MDDRRPRERELVLAPNEYAFILDTTKGHIGCYVGPNKTSLAQTDLPVRFDSLSKRFESVDLADATLLFPTAPANWYMILKNPARSDVHPTVGVHNAMTALRVGEKICVQGPASFPLWPGQMAKVIQGHRLHSNQYLTVRVYDAAAADAAWNDAIGAPDDEPAPSFVPGESRILRGTDLAFFMPPTGIEVLPDEHGHYVRDAVTLRRLEYCILVGEDGARTYVRGEAVVFPEPNQHFLTQAGPDGASTPVFQAIELSETTGVHIKVVAPYIDEDGDHFEGDELFITGASSGLIDVSDEVMARRGGGRIYFPRVEHAIVRYGEHRVTHAIAVPKGQGRYVLDRISGEITLLKGPAMLLPDPRRQVITRRVLSDRECGLFYPGNTEALAFNRRLRQTGEATVRGGEFVAKTTPRTSARVESAPGLEPGDELSVTRPDTFVEPRSITLDNRYLGVVSLDIWPGYAVQVVDRAGARRVEEGPGTVLLGFDETLAPLSLSRGTPKRDESLLQTSYLKVMANKVSDKVEVVTADMVALTIGVAYRVAFEGADPQRWFAVENYVKLLCDHAGSMVKSAARKDSVHGLQSRLTEVVRDALLGVRDDDGIRRGLVFVENGMRLYDVDVLSWSVVDPAIGEMLEEAKQAAVERAIDVGAKETELLYERRLADVERGVLDAAHATETRRLALEQELDAVKRALAEERTLGESALRALRQGHALESVQRQAAIVEQELATEARRGAQVMATASAKQELALAALRAQVAAAVEHADAMSPQLVAALQRLGDEQLLGALSSGFGELAAIEGRGLLETARKFMDFVPRGFMPMLGGAELAGSVEEE